MAKKTNSISNFYKHSEKSKGGELHFRESILRTIRDEMDQWGLERSVADTLRFCGALVDNYVDIENEN